MNAAVTAMSASMLIMLMRLVTDAATMQQQALTKDHRNRNCA